jgi:hypothetical protein
MQGSGVAFQPCRDLLLTTPDTHHPGASRQTAIASSLLPPSTGTNELIIIDPPAAQS